VPRGLFADRGFQRGGVGKRQRADRAAADIGGGRAAGGTAAAMPLDVTDRAAVIAGFDAFAAEYGLCPAPDGLPAARRDR